MSVYLSVSDLSFTYDSFLKPLFSNLDFRFSPGWTGIVGANGSGKTTFLKLMAGEIQPDRGTIRRSGACSFCRQEVDFPPPEAAEFFGSYDTRSFRIQEKLHVDSEMLMRWPTLSLGERKRIQIGTSLFSSPDVLCIDEPTNHLDAEARQFLFDALRRFSGVGLLVSHDRLLLDSLCSQCLFLENGSAVLRSGSVSQGYETRDREVICSQRENHRLKVELKRSKAELQRRRERAQQMESRDSKRLLDPHDADGRGRINLARLTGRSGHAAHLAGRQADALRQTGEHLQDSSALRQTVCSLKLPYGEYSSRNALLDVSGGELAVGPHRLLLPPLRIENRDRIALTGANGIGKTTLLRHICANLLLPPENVLFMPQELDAAACAAISEELEHLSRDDYSRVMTVVASLGSSPDRIRQSASHSPGEWRKLFFGLGVLRRIQLVVMDEPTNHLDLPSITCLQEALKACSCALLLVSHDASFLCETCSIRWHVQRESPKTRRLKIGENTVSSPGGA